jgi:hypothetical protein
VSSGVKDISTLSPEPTLKIRVHSDSKLNNGLREQQRVEQKDDNWVDFKEKKDVLRAE